MNGLQAVGFEGGNMGMVVDTAIGMVRYEV